MVTHKLKDGHPPEEDVLQTLNLVLRLNSQNLYQVTTSMDGHLPSLGWSPTNPRMVNNQKEVYYKLGIWHLDLTHKKKAIQLPWMVTYHPKDGHPQPKDGHPPEGSVVQI